MFKNTAYLYRYSLMRNAHLLGIKNRSYAQTGDSKNPSDSELDLMRSRLIYQSRKRGILENCIIFTTFADKYLKTFNFEQLQKYDALINSKFDEWDLYAWSIGSKPAPQEFNTDILELLKNHVLKRS
ncbi:PREDICTED: succinate dehydrogenase assembly factor 2-B, mitochondrial-like [Diuraphis noxia]|uniref:succinate dehydrogenase assembly factor 2-B, mitochondrial-like n=1 Tax=Diuraphis noxia TaxID=143948 RepID=UPI0007637470|nr:PREDICTED: succinate dehydrogenase assembly factor 2-B, mitochondrial-like [Diuraphis noxia]